ncbi:MAG: hypothetical protein MJ121_00590 [Clostridia bacterium]|nr:hypothetical protein [Clostridia bacterium]
MSMTEKVAYLKGLADGMELGEGKNEKLLKAIIDTLGEMAETVDDIDGDLDAFCEQLDAVDEDLAELEEVFYDDDIDYDDDYDFDDDFEYEDGLYDVECPSCGEVITVDEEILEEGGIECPACGENLEFDFEYDEDEEE